MNIKSYKEQSGKTYREIAEACGIDKGYVCRGVLSPGKISYGVFLKIAIFIDIPKAEAIEIWRSERKRIILDQVKLRHDKIIQEG